MIMPKKRLISGIPESKYLCFGAADTTQPAAPCDGNADPGKYVEQCVFAGAVSVNDVQYFALLESEVDVVQCLKRGAFFNRLACKPERGSFRLCSWPSWYSLVTWLTSMMGMERYQLECGNAILLSTDGVLFF